MIETEKNRTVEPIYIADDSGMHVAALFQFNDGGRREAGFCGAAGDCVTRSIAIATETPYREVYDALAAGEAKRGRPRSARKGIQRPVYDAYLEGLGWEWTATMQIGSGCNVHLRPDELPYGRLIVRVTKHITTMIYGVIHDTGDPTRGGTRCVYGYWRKVSGDE